MAERKSTQQQQYEMIMNGLRAHDYLPVYILMGTTNGTESYYLDVISQYVLDNVLAEEERDFNQVLFYGHDVNMRQVIEQCKRFPMMAERQVVVLREAHAAKEFNLLEKYLEHPNPTTLLVVCYKGAIDARKKILTLAQKVGKVAAFAPHWPSELVPFIEDYARQKETTIDRKASTMLADSVGSDLKRLVSEIDKMCVVFPPGSPKNITPAIVERCVGISKDFNGFELRDALAKRDVYKVNLIVKHLISEKTSGALLGIVPIVFSYFQNLMLAYYAPQPRNASAIMSYVGLANERAAMPFIDGMKNYTPMKTMMIIDKLHEIDARCKGIGGTNNTTEMDLAVELFSFILQ